jgi:hypothetical protein
MIAMTIECEGLVNDLGRRNVGRWEGSPQHVINSTRHSSTVPVASVVRKVGR